MKAADLFKVVNALSLGMAEADAAAAEAEPATKRFLKKDYDAFSPDGAGGKSYFEYGDGTSQEFNIFDLPEEQQYNLMMHGWAQKGGDSTAGVKGDYTKAKANVQEVWETLKSNQWRAARGEGEARPRTEDLALAISRLKKLDLDRARAVVEGADEAKRKEWRGHPAIKHALSVIRSEALAKAAEAAGDFQP